MRAHAALRLLLFGYLFLLISCSSSGPALDELTLKVRNLEQRLSETDKILNRYSERIPSDADVTADIRIELLNRVFSGLSSFRRNDVTVIFPPTRNLVREEKSILGIGYTDVLDIDSGRVRMNLTRFDLVSIQKGVLRVVLEIAGSGRIAVSGRYTAIPFSGEPDVRILVRDTVRFLAEGDKGGVLVLKPLKGTVKLRTRFSKKFLGWDVGYDEETPLQVTELIPEFRIPLSLGSQLSYSIPAPGSEIAITLTLENTRVTADDNRILFRTNLGTKRAR